MAAATEVMESVNAARMEGAEQGRGGILVPSADGVEPLACVV